MIPGFKYEEFSDEEHAAREKACYEEFIFRDLRPIASAFYARETPGQLSDEVWEPGGAYRKQRKEGKFGWSQEAWVRVIAEGKEAVIDCLKSF